MRKSIRGKVEARLSNVHAERAEVARSVNMIGLTKGEFAFVDEQDFEFLSAIKWRLKVEPDGRKYAVGHRPGSGKHGKTIFMHRAIMGVSDPAIKVDHRDGDGLNNRRSNLRNASNAQNIRNQRPHIDKKTCQFKGVCFYPTTGTFRAQIMANYRKFNLGSYATAEEAARVYDSKARELHGEFARTNFQEVRV